jgi:hypothetical protein
VSSEPEHFEVLPDCWSALELFLALQGQWRVVAGFGGVFYQGLDYPAVESLLRLKISSKKKRARLFDQIRLIEQGALSTINDKK